MHTSTTPSGTRYHHNSDFSGDIHIVLPADKIEGDGGARHALISGDDIRAIAAHARWTESGPPAWADLIDERSGTERSEPHV